jgi:hypothetical protein
LQNPRSRGFLVQDDLLFVARAVGMEPFMELSRTRVDRVCAEDEVKAPRLGLAEVAGRHAAPSRRSCTSSSLRINKLAKPR